MSLFPPGPKEDRRHDDAREAFHASLGPARRHFEAMTPIEVRDEIGCDLHVSLPGVWCAKQFGSYLNCIDRRVAAAKKRIDDGR